jgi:muramoyltetrapeptide carboxypeptidase
MQRRSFLEKFGSLGALVAASPSLLAFKPDPPAKYVPHPPYLKEGDFVGITCPAGSIDQKDARYAEVMLSRWGLKTKIGKTIGKDWNRFAGTDEERAADLQHQLDDPMVKAIIFGRGGYGTMRMMDKINWDGFKKNPKWLIGYSDITAFHCHINRNFGIPTIHGRMAAGFGTVEDYSETSLKNALTGKPLMYKWKSFGLNRPGSVQGQLVGGNLSLIYAMQASPSELDTKGKILFIEDVSEYKYTVDRMLMNLKRSGKLENLAALLVGGFTQTKEDADGYFRMTMEDIIFEKVAEYKYPVAFAFPAGHQSPNLALKFGMPHQLVIGEEECMLAEPHAIQPFAPITFGHDSIPAPIDTLQNFQQPMP